VPKSGLYIDFLHIDFLPKLNSKMIRLVDNPRVVNQIAALERRTARGGKDRIDHAPGARRLGQRDRRRGLLRRQPLYVERFGVADLARDQRSRAVDLGH
jgi:hypothetical protein